MFSIWVKIRCGILPSFSLLDPQIGGTQHVDNHKQRKFGFETLRLVQNVELLPRWKAARYSEARTYLSQSHPDFYKWQR